MTDHKLTPVLYVWQDAVMTSALSTRARLVAWVLADHMKTWYLECYPGTARIVEKSGLSRRTVQGAVKDLETAGFLIHKPGHYGKKNVPNRYLGIFPLGGSADFALGVAQALHEGDADFALGVAQELHEGSADSAPELPKELPTQLPNNEKNLTDFVGPAEQTKVAWNLEALLSAAELQFFDSLSTASPAIRKCFEETVLAEHGQCQRIKAAAGIEERPRAERAA